MPIGAPGRARGSRGASPRRRRDRPDEQPAHRVQIDVAMDEVTRAGDPEQQRGMQEVGADHARGREREEEQEREPEERARADRREADDEAERGTDHDRDHPHASRDREVVVILALRDGRNVFAGTRARRGSTRRRRPCSSSTPPSRGMSLQSERRRARADRADEHPEREARVHVPELPVAPGAEGLEDGAVQDVGSDRGLRVEAEERISIGVISEPPPIPVMPTSVPTSARPAMTNCQVMFGSGIGHDTNGRPVRRQPSLYASQPVQNRWLRRGAPAPQREGRALLRATHPAA